MKYFNKLPVILWPWLATCNALKFHLETGDLKITTASQLAISPEWHNTRQNRKMCQQISPLCIPTSDNNFNSCNHAIDVSTIPFLLFLFLSAIVSWAPGSEKNKKNLVSRIPTFRQFISRGFRFLSLSWLLILVMGDYLFHQKASLSSSVSAEFAIIQPWVSISHPAAHLNARATSNPNLRSVLLFTLGT